MSAPTADIVESFQIGASYSHGSKSDLEMNGSGFKSLHSLMMIIVLKTIIASWEFEWRRRRRGCRKAAWHDHEKAVKRRQQTRVHAGASNEEVGGEPG